MTTYLCDLHLKVQLSSVYGGFYRSPASEGVRDVVHTFAPLIENNHEYFYVFRNSLILCLNELLI